MLYNPNKHSYLNKSFDYIASGNIKEYDIKSAGFNMLIAAKAIDQKTINYLNSLPKQKRKVVEGLMQRENKELTKVINEGLCKYRRLFIEANGLEDEQILTVKRDAIFVINAKIKQSKFDNVEFRPKNSYTSYYYIDGIEYYYSPINDTLDYKNLADNFNKVKEHEKFMFKFLKEVFRLNAVSRESASKYIKEFADKYRKKKLPMGYYRELNESSLYRLKGMTIGHSDLAVDIPADIDDIDIRYNYLNIILPLVRLVY